MTSVYVLVDPRNSRMYYVGRSYTPRRRLSQHFVDSRQRQRPNRSLKNWLKELALLGLKPLVVEIEKAPSAAGRAREEQWIKKLWAAGAPLFNRRGVFSQRCPWCKAFSVAEVDGTRYCLDCDWTSESD